jgi:hypothetical protein
MEPAKDVPKRLGRNWERPRSTHKARFGTKEYSVLLKVVKKAAGRELSSYRSLVLRCVANELTVDSNFEKRAS